MTQEKQNKHINPKTGDLESDCTQVDNYMCLKDVSIVYISTSPATTFAGVPRVGIILNGETEVRYDFIVNISVGDFINVDTQSVIIMTLLKEALITGKKMDICIHPQSSKSAIIVDAALKKQ